MAVDGEGRLLRASDYVDGMVHVFADAAATWAAIGALGTLGATGVAFLTAVWFTRRQTEMAERSAGNAKVAAQEAVEANRLTRTALEVSNESLSLARRQLDVAAREVDAVEKQARLTLDALYAADRPYFVPDEKLAFDDLSQTFRLGLRNHGKGPGRVAGARLMLPLPDNAVVTGEPPASATPVDGRSDVYFSGSFGSSPPAGKYTIELTVVNALGEDARVMVLRYELDPRDSWDTGAGARLVSATPFRWLGGGNGDAEKK